MLRDSRQARDPGKETPKAPTIRSRPSTNGTPKRIAVPMPTFEQGEVVRVPFPYTDRETRQHRPALVVSRAGLARTSSFFGW